MRKHMLIPGGTNIKGIFQIIPVCLNVTYSLELQTKVIFLLNQNHLLLLCLPTLHLRSEGETQQTKWQMENTIENINYSNFIFYLQ